MTISGTQSQFQNERVKIKTLQLDGTDITATAAEINAAAGTGVSSTELDLLDGALAGTAVASKALALGANKNVDTLVIADGGLYLGAVAGTQVTATAAEMNYLDITTLGTGVASKAVVLDTGDDYTWPSAGILTYGVLKDSAATTITATGAEINYLDIASLGTGVASKAVVLSATGTYVGPTAATTKLTWSVTSDSTDGGTSVEPFVHNTTMTGIGGVGGRARFQLDTSVVLGSWSNALKAQTIYGATGATTGLGSAFVAEMTLSAGTTSGTYAPIEIELNMGSAGSTGTSTSMIYMQVNDSNKTVFDTNGFLFDLVGVTAGSDGVKMYCTVSFDDVGEITHGLRCKVAGLEYYIPLIPQAQAAD